MHFCHEEGRHPGHGLTLLSAAAARRVCRRSSSSSSATTSGTETDKKASVRAARTAGEGTTEPPSKGEAIDRCLETPSSVHRMLKNTSPLRQCESKVVLHKWTFLCSLSWCSTHAVYLSFHALLLSLSLTSVGAAAIAPRTTPDVGARRRSSATTPRQE